MNKIPMTQPQAILCIDIDGTLMNEEGLIHPHDVEILQNFTKAVQPILTTGRNINTVKKIFKANGLLKDSKLELPGVFMNGGLAFLPGEILSSQNIFTPQTLQALIKIAVESKTRAFAFFTLREVFLVNPNDDAWKILDLLFEEPQACEPADVPGEVFKIMIIDRNPQAPDPVKSKAKGLDIEIVFSLPFAYEFNPLGISKANTLQKLIAALGIEGLPIYAVGDAHNDLSLFALSRQSFAPSSAQPAVLEHADHIIQRDRDGIFSTILNHLEFP